MWYFQILIFVIFLIALRLQVQQGLEKVLVNILVSS